MNFDELNKNDLGYNGVPTYEKGFEAGQQSQQAKIDELQARVDKALKLVQKDCIEYGVSDFLEKAMDILKGN